MPFEGQQQSTLSSPAFEKLGGGSKGGGKALSLDTPLPTPTGWTTMGEVRAGDFLFDEQGAICQVVATSEVMHDRPCYRVTFSDGAEIVADAEHRWYTWTLAERAAATRRTPEFRARRRKTRASRGTGASPWLAERNRENPPPTLPPATGGVRTTAEIRATLRSGGKLNALNHAVDVAQPLLTRVDVDLPIDPYMLGMWLGDGTSRTGRLAVGLEDDETIEHVRALGYEARRLDSEPKSVTVYGLHKQLRLAGLLQNKHIPPAYLRASAPQRLALLEGLIDSDGHVDKRGQVEITLVRREIIDGLLELLHSLGIKAVAHESRATLNGKDCGPRWRIKFVAPFPVARLTRKRERQKTEGLRPTTRFRFITAVEPVESVPVKCVQVDSPSRLYLAGREMIPTHNSDILLAEAVRQVGNPRYKGLILRQTVQGFQEILARAKVLYGKMGGQWKEVGQMFTFPSGATIEFGHCADLAAAERYQGRQFHTICYDEIGQLASEKVWTTLLAEIRSTDPTIRCSAVCSANPGGPGHSWIKRRFIHPCGALGDRVHEWKDDISGLSFSRAFIPSKVKDNKALPAAYAAMLRASLNDAQRRALLDGDWDAGEGLLLEELDWNVHWIQPFPIPDHWHLFGAYDHGWAHPFCYGGFAVDEQRNVYLFESVHGRHLRDDEIVERIYTTLGNALGRPWKPRLSVAGRDVKNENRSRTENTPTVQEEFTKMGLPLSDANQDRRMGVNTMRNYIAWRRMGEGGKDGKPRFYIFATPNNRKVFECLESLVSDPDDPEVPLKIDADENGEGGDDAADMVRYGLASRPLGARVPEQAERRSPHYDSEYEKMAKMIQKQQNGTGRGFS